MLERMRRKGNPRALLVGMQTGAPLSKTVWRVLKILKMQLLYDPVIPLLGIYLKKPEILFQENISMPMFIVV